MRRDAVGGDDDAMKIEVRHGPSFAVARIALAGRETVRAEAGAMMATSPDVTIEASTEGGLVKGIKRSVLGGESMFVSRFTAGPGGGWVDVAPGLPGDVVEIEVAGAVNLARGAWLCSSDGVEIETKWGGMKNLLGGEGGFLVRATGTGSVLASCYGAIDVHDLADGERLVLDTGHMVAFDDTLAYSTRDVSGGLVQSLKSGERLVFEFTGPGRLWTQSRSPRDLTDWLAGKLPFKRK